MSKLANPIFIVGAPRSGTSILGRMLENHKDLAHIKESRVLWKFGNDGKSDMLDASNAQPEVISHIRNKIDRLISNKVGTRLLDKTVNNTVRLPFLLSVFPDAKVIHIIRNGYDSSLSIQKHWLRAADKGVTNRRRQGSKGTVLQQRIKELDWTQVPFYAKEFVTRSILSKKGAKPNFLYGVRLPGLREVLKEQTLLDACALMWRTSVETACYYGRQMHQNQYREVRFENLNEEVLLSLGEFLDLPSMTDVIDYFANNFDSTKITSHKELISKEQVDTLNKWTIPTLSWLDYEVINNK